MGGMDTKLLIAICFSVATASLFLLAFWGFKNPARVYPRHWQWACGLAFAGPVLIMGGMLAGLTDAQEARKETTQKVEAIAPQINAVERQIWKATGSYTDSLAALGEQGPQGRKVMRKLLDEYPEASLRVESGKQRYVIQLPVEEPPRLPVEEPRRATFAVSAERGGSEQIKSPW